MIFLREYPAENVAMDGGLQSENPKILEALKNVMTTSQDRWPTDYGQQDAKSAAHSGNARLTLMVSTLGGG